MLTNSFKHRFTSTHNSPRNDDLSFITPLVSEANQYSLLTPISDEEVKQATFDINPDKAPSSDGFGSKFFQAYWSTIGKEVTTAVQSFFHHEKLTPSLNHTLITLILKIDHPENPNHFRPISLINTLYKIISKILVARLSPILQRIISPFQNAFMPDRSIHDNNLIVKEILNTFHKS